MLVTTVLELLAGGASWPELREDYPGLETEDIQACLEYAAQLAHLSELENAQVIELNQQMMRVWF
ncbi:DUF433 domain-containing protein [Spirosoma sp. KUDC1026]|uniref:DUF433 domain-containing protein n=1 Tax=Spirosoma sp. KUDC1026 TaxID=2745947 RepID=UPI00293BFC11|nr:DUF433 domain-containing protein [Spirosoma sp. KUDC1026]